MFTFTQIVALIMVAVMFLIIGYTVWMTRKLLPVIMANKQVAFSKNLLWLMLGMFSVRTVLNLVIEFVPQSTPVLSIIMAVATVLLFVLAGITGIQMIRILRRARADELAIETKQQK